MMCKEYGGFPKLRVLLWEAPIVRTVIFWSLKLGSPYLWKPPYLGSMRHMRHGHIVFTA